MQDPSHVLGSGGIARYQVSAFPLDLEDLKQRDDAHMTIFLMPEALDHHLHGGFVL